MFDLFLGGGAKAQSCNGGFTVEEVCTTRVGHEICRNARSLGFFFCTKKLIEVFSCQTDFGAGRGRKIYMVFCLSGGVCLNKCAKICMASL